jgi:hypothetical protein
VSDEVAEYDALADMVMEGEPDMLLVTLVDAVGSTLFDVDAETDREALPDAVGEYEFVTEPVIEAVQLVELDPDVVPVTDSEPVAVMLGETLLDRLSDAEPLGETDLVIEAVVVIEEDREMLPLAVTEADSEFDTEMDELTDTVLDEVVLEDTEGVHDIEADGDGDVVGEVLTEFVTEDVIVTLAVTLLLPEGLPEPDMEGVTVRDTVAEEVTDDEGLLEKLIDGEAVLEEDGEGELVIGISGSNRKMVLPSLENDLDGVNDPEYRFPLLMRKLVM